MIKCVGCSPEARWPIYASVNSATMGSDNRMSPVRCLCIIGTNLGTLSTGHLGITVKFETKYKHLLARKLIWKCYLQNDCHFYPGLSVLIRVQILGIARSFQKAPHPIMIRYVIGNWWPQTTATLLPRAWNSLRPRQNGHHFSHENFKCISLNDFKQNLIEIGSLWSYWQQGEIGYENGHYLKYRKTSGISRAFVGNKIVDNSDVVGASPVGAAPTTSSFST